MREGGYSLVEPTRVAYGPPPPARPPPRSWRPSSATKRGLKWLGSGVGVLATIISLLVGYSSLAEKSDTQIRQQAEILAELRFSKERQGDLKKEVAENKKQTTHLRESLVVVWAVIQTQLGVEPPRGVDDKAVDQVRIAPSRNARRPMKPFTQDGKEYAVPEPPTQR